MKTLLSRATGTLIACSLLVLMSAGVDAAALDTPAITAIEAGTAKIELMVTAGATGAPGGFSVWWMTTDEYAANGYVWPSALTSIVTEASFTGTPVVNVFAGMASSFQLGPHESIYVQIGDIFDEMGVTATDYEELDPATGYVFCVFANQTGAWEQSGFSPTIGAGTSSGSGCHHTIGYWKNHESVWAGVGLTLGTNFYNTAQLLSILNQPSGGNGLLILGHQLIAAKLNVLVLGADPSPVAAEIAAADALIGALVIPPVGADWVDPSTVTVTSETLDDYNNGLSGGGCGTTATEEASWGTLKELFR
ncbi:MAG: hypothetical protein HKN20_01660 [Gemmatimonadetes bacterium]|nr:hypothetical protein [Gemmatimonadota bacterium]